MSKPILIGLSPNTDASDAWLAFKLLLQPWRWQIGLEQPQLKAALKKYLKFPHVYLTNSSRTALYLGLKNLRLPAGSEVVYPEFTCTVVPQAIVKAGLKPATKLSPQTKAMIIQHLFGEPDDLTKIVRLCRQRGIILVEDLAHSLGAKYLGKPVGSFGNLTVLSFGRDKIISSVFGGALLSRRPLAGQLPLPGAGWIARQLLHPLIFALAVPTYFYLGKYLIYLCRKLGLITLPLTNLEPAALPNALAVLAIHQWRKLNKLNQHRREIAKIYCQTFKRRFNPSATYLRFPLKVPDPAGLIKFAKRRHILLGNWYENKIVNLPTHWRMDQADARRVVAVVKEYVHQ